MGGGEWGASQQLFPNQQLFFGRWRLRPLSRPGSFRKVLMGDPLLTKVVALPVQRWGQSRSLNHLLHVRHPRYVDGSPSAGVHTTH